MKKIMLLLLFFASAFSGNILAAEPMLPSLGNGGNPFADGGFQDFAKNIEDQIKALPPEELERLNKEMENVVNNLPPEALQELEQFMQMSPEEQESYAVNAFAEFDKNKSSLEENMAEQEKVSDGIAKKSNTELESENRKIASTRELINDLITKLESYFSKINSIPDIANKIEKWGNKQARLISWQQDATFNQFKKSAQLFIQQLHSINEPNKKINKNLFLLDIYNNEKLKTSLKNLQRILLTWEPKILMQALEFQAVSKDSKKAIVQATNGILSALYEVALPKALDDIVVKYDPEAKKLREEKEKLEKQALNSSKYGSPKGQTLSYGSDTTHQENASGHQDFYDDSSYDPYSSYDFGKYDDYGDYDYPSSKSYGQNDSFQTNNNTDIPRGKGLPSSSNQPSRVADKNSRPLKNDLGLKNTPPSKNSKNNSSEDSVILSSKEEKSISAVSSSIANAIKSLEEELSDPKEDKSSKDKDSDSVTTDLKNKELNDTSDEIADKLKELLGDHNPTKKTVISKNKEKITSANAILENAEKKLYQISLKKNPAKLKDIAAVLEDNELLSKRLNWLSEAAETTNNKVIKDTAARIKKNIKSLKRGKKLSPYKKPATAPTA